jgi:hypothetical protein
MKPDAASISLSQKVKALRQIQFVLCQSTRATPRACGLSEEEFPVLANEGLLELTFFLDPGEAPDLDRYHIESISDKGMGVLACAHTAEPEPLKISVVPHHKSIWRKLYDGTRNGLWDLIKVTVGAAIGWFLKKYFP